MELSDWELIEQFRLQGCRSCLNELVGRHLPKTRALIFPMVGQVALADDLTQETFLRVIRSLPSFQGKAQFSTWVARIAVNVVREHYRQQRRRPVHSVEQVDDLISWNDSPDKNTRNAEMADDIQAALLELPEEWREAVVLVCIRGYTTSDAAKI